RLTSIQGVDVELRIRSGLAGELDGAALELERSSECAEAESVGASLRQQRTAESEGALGHSGSWRRLLESDSAAELHARCGRAKPDAGSHNDLHFADVHALEHRWTGSAFCARWRQAVDQSHERRVVGTDDTLPSHVG